MALIARRHGQRKVRVQTHSTIHIMQIHSTSCHAAPCLGEFAMPGPTSGPATSRSLSSNRSRAPLQASPTSGHPIRKRSLLPSDEERATRLISVANIGRDASEEHQADRRRSKSRSSTRRSNSRSQANDDKKPRPRRRRNSDDCSFRERKPRSRLQTIVDDGVEKKPRSRRRNSSDCSFRERKDNG